MISLCNLSLHRWRFDSEHERTCKTCGQRERRPVHYMSPPNVWIGSTWVKVEDHTYRLARLLKKLGVKL